MKNKGKYLLVILTIVAVLLCGILVYSGLGGESQVEKLNITPAESLNNGWSVIQGKSQFEIPELPARVRLTNGQVHLQRSLPQEIDAGSCLAFENNYCSVEVYVDGQAIYSFVKEQGMPFGNMYGTSLCIVDMKPSYGGKTLTIDYNYPYNNNATIFLSSVSVGERNEITASLLRSNLGLIAFLLLMSVMSLSYFGIFIYHVIQRNQGKNTLYFHMGAFLFLSALWVFTDSLLVQCFTSQTLVYGCVVSFLAFMFMGMPFLAIAKQFCPRGKKVFTAIQVIILVYNMVTIFLLLGNIAAFPETLIPVHVVFILAILALEYFSLKDVRHGKNPYAIHLFAGNTILLLILAVSLVGFYFGSSGDVSRFYRYGLLVMSGALLAIVAKKIRISEELNNRMNVYREIAYLDIMTGLKNRNAFISEVESLEKNLGNHHSVTVISLDINNLKLINDKFGHVRGDEVISGVASIIPKVFVGEKMIYRMGGDEFAVIICDQQVDISKLQAAVDEECSRLKNKIGLDVSIAIGSAQTEIAGDNQLSIIKLLDISDLAMYKNKAVIKDRTDEFTL